MQSAFNVNKQQEVGGYTMRKQKRYTHTIANRELWGKSWRELFELFHTPAGTFKSRHDHAAKCLLDVSRTLALMPDELIEALGSLQAVVNEALDIVGGTVAA